MSLSTTSSYRPRRPSTKPLHESGSRVPPSEAYRDRSSPVPAAKASVGLGDAVARPAVHALADRSGDHAKRRPGIVRSRPVRGPGVARRRSVSNDGRPPAMPPRNAAWLGEPNPSRFNELNVRTYVKVAGQPGVLFFSLDAESRLAVRMARRFFHLPYFDAEMKFETVDDGWIRYHQPPHARRCPGRPRLAPPLSSGSRQPAPVMGPPGTLETSSPKDTACTYSISGAKSCAEKSSTGPGRCNRRSRHSSTRHDPPALEIELVDQPTCLHFARRLDVVAWTNVRPPTSPLSRPLTE